MTYFLLLLLLVLHIAMPSSDRRLFNYIPQQFCSISPILFVGWSRISKFHPQKATGKLFELYFSFSKYFSIDSYYVLLIFQQNLIYLFFIIFNYYCGTKNPQRNNCFSR